jgi:hypothetical protein
MSEDGNRWDLTAHRVTFSPKGSAHNSNLKEQFNGILKKLCTKT